MNLQPLFDMQRELDAKILLKKGLSGQDLLGKKILALQVELGELANEWRGFKFWSENQEPRTYGFYDDKDCEYCNGTGTIREHPSDTGYGCPDCERSGFMHYNPLLEEYVDCLHFILSIGNESENKIKENFIHKKKMPNILDQFMWTNKKIVEMYQDYRDEDVNTTAYHFTHVFSAIWGLGEMLGFTWEEIEQSYYEKNKINHERQNNGY